MYELILFVVLPPVVVAMGCSVFALIFQTRFMWSAVLAFTASLAIVSYGSWINEAKLSYREIFFIIFWTFFYSFNAIVIAGFMRCLGAAAGLKKLRVHDLVSSGTESE